MQQLAPTYAQAVELAEMDQVKRAAEIIGWQGVGVLPEESADTYYAFGCVASLIGEEGAQEWAKDLFTRAAEAYQLSGDSDAANTARVRLAICYWRQGATENALSFLKSLNLNGASSAVKAHACLTTAAIHIHSENYQLGLKVLDRAARYVQSQPSCWAAHYHNQRGIALKCLGNTEQACEEYEIAVSLFSAARHTSHEAATLNNLAALYTSTGEFDKSTLLTDRVKAIYTASQEWPLLAKTCETAATNYLERDDALKALISINEGVSVLDNSEDKAALPSLLRTRAKVYLRLKNEPAARLDLKAAASQCEDDGDPVGAANCYLTMMESLNLTPPEFAELYRCADTLNADPDRLKQCAKLLAEKIKPPASLTELRNSVRLHEEAILIAEALKRAKGDVAVAASLIGLTRPGLAYKLKNHHPELLPLRKPPRKRSIIKH